MWDKDIIKELFPSGILPSDGTPIENLIDSEYDVVMTQEHKVARNMVHHISNISWYPDGRVMREELYDVYPFPAIDGTPLLSVYGGKMLQNWLQLPYYHDGSFLTAEEKKENINNVGFNYTGI